MNVGRGVAWDCCCIAGRCHEVWGKGRVGFGAWGWGCVGGVWCVDVGARGSMVDSGGGWRKVVIVVGVGVVSVGRCESCRRRRGGC
jgi:hypothetical protein